ncbi:adenosine deaminase/editase [Xylaria arbuscula]|nr:adenosine deaminase/editase [Xylaria arbuscula]
MTINSDQIASLVQQEFDKLPAKRKPVIRDNGLREWVPLSGIVAEDKTGKLTCLSLATGMKCLPSSKLPQAQGNVLHDWHAEVLAIRAFNCFVLDECRALASGSKGSSEFIRRRSSAEVTAAIPKSISVNRDGVNWHGQPFTWREDVKLHMYCSEAPCGDASMELTMASQEDATPWAIPAKGSPSPISPFTPHPSSLGPDALLLGRGYFSQLGIVRRKPSRGDAPPTLSKSCSDKLSLHQCTSLLSSPTSLLVSPEHAYISTLILPRSQYSASGCRRAFSDGDEDGGEEEAGLHQEARMAPLVAQSKDWAGGYKFQPFTVKTTDVEFSFSRRSALCSSSSCASPTRTGEDGSLPTSSSGIRITPSNLSAARIASGREETTLNGVLQGHKASAAHIRGASFASRRRIWDLAVQIADFLGEEEPQQQQQHQEKVDDDYEGTGGRREKERIKEALGIPDSPPTAPSTSPTAVQPQSQSQPPPPTAQEKKNKTYRDLKDNAPLLAPRRQVKQAARSTALKGWVRNTGDEDFVLWDISSS